ncbi:MAG: hypothetical protein PHG98_07335, partial [Bacteroidales bacterium]|nr:hypothetical protein [Bacteroidales bacterium]
MKKIFLFIIISLSFYMTGVSQSIYSLEECKKLALENNTKIKNSILDVEMSKQTQKEVFTKLFPNVSAMGFIAKSNEGMLQKQIHMPPILSSF